MSSNLSTIAYSGLSGNSDGLTAAILAGRSLLPAADEFLTGGSGGGGDRTEQKLADLMAGLVVSLLVVLAEFCHESTDDDCWI
jgi:hypothetical protein